MTLSRVRQLAAGCLMIGLPRTELDADSAEKIKKLDPAGLILFGRNLSTFHGTRTLLERFTDLISRPPLLAIDQEGGRVSRLERWIGPTLPAHRLATRAEDPVREFGAVTGRALRCLGLNVDFAPVADLSPHGSANGIGDRAFSIDPAVVTRMTRAFLLGLQREGVAGCLKHFPGLGDTAVDSHETLPTVERTLDQLRATDLQPYRELGNLPACVMVGHGHYPAFDGERPLPATISPEIVTGELRLRLGYDGLVVSDDMEMGAIADRDTEGEAAVAAIRAGCDLLLYCSDLERAAVAARALAEAARESRKMRDRLQDAADRVATVAARWSIDRAYDATAWAGCVEAFVPYRVS